ncbi:hypothetical protein KIPB_012878, partial [Kipferlia bialata]|eukprot:g12878.t1
MCAVTEGVSLQRDGTQSEGQLRDIEAEAESDTKMTKAKLVSASQHESSEEDPEDSEGTSSETDVMMDGESEESAWEETESESESNEGEGSVSDSAIQDTVTVPKQAPVGGAVGDTRTYIVSSRVRSLVTVPVRKESNESEPTERPRHSMYDAKWNAKLEDLREYLSVHGVWPPQNSGTLGKWVDRQRYMNRNNHLAQWRVVALEGL